MTSLILRPTIKASTDLTSASSYLLNCNLAKLNRLRNDYLSAKVRDAEYETLLEHINTLKGNNAKLVARLEKRYNTLKIARLMLVRGRTRTAKAWIAAKLD